MTGGPEMTVDPYMLYGVLAGVVLLAFVAAMVYWTHRRSRTLLEGWAEQNGYHILAAEMRWLRRGPFFWTTSRGQTVYHVTVIDPQGQTLSGYVRCGSFWWGLFSDKVEVRWE